MRNWTHKKQNAFTLAEVLITLGLIGVVAAMTIPTLLNNIHDSVQKRAIAVASRKFTKSLEAMQASEAMASYNDTNEFVNALKNYLQIVKVCDAEHLKDCWKYEYITLYNGQNYLIEYAKAGDVFKMGNKDFYNNDADFSSQNVAIVTADGTSLLLNYNKKCSNSDPRAAVNCVVALIETNGAKRPNQLGKDVALLNATSFYNTAIPPENSKLISCIGDRAECVDAVEATSIVNAKGTRIWDYDEADSSPPKW